MDDKMMVYLLELISNEDLIKITKKVKMKIKGFRTIQIRNGIMLPPKKIVIKELLSYEYNSTIKEIFEKDSKTKISLQINKDNISKDIDVEEKKTILETLEKLTISNSNIKVISNEQGLYSNNIDMFGEKKGVEDKLENKKALNDDYIKQIEILNREIKNLKDKVSKLEKKNIELDNNNNNIIKDIKKLNKQKTILQNENEKIRKSNKVKSVNNEKYISDFYNIKKKYDQIKNINDILEKNINEKLLQIKKLEEFNLTIKNKLTILENNEIERRKLQTKKVAIIGQIYSKDMKSLDNYEIHNIDTKKIEDLKINIDKFNEIWLLSYNIPYIDIIKVQDNIDKRKIKEFTSYKILKEYLKKEIL